MARDSTFALACSFVRETDNAICINDPASGEDIWIPLSQVEEIHRDADGKTGRVVMSEWIARKKGLC